MACIAGEGPIAIEHLPERYRARTAVVEESNGNGAATEHRRSLLRDTERAYWVGMLQKHHGDVRKGVRRNQAQPVACLPASRTVPIET